MPLAQDSCPQELQGVATTTQESLPEEPKAAPWENIVWEDLELDVQEETIIPKEKPKEMGVPKKVSRHNTKERNKDAEKWMISAFPGRGKRKKDVKYDKKKLHE
ncbi:hypothetical protein E2562_039324 [Oryza meyeriana var. granulata]|uniref:Uncharacterized protein n=1 Tax=Oryza meyeriana var. granulata TaxID=110450 RepID=A0A6G1E8Y5_9ORYZ|nr:hypothetical protein E2562_039324 [Oryza meyeriana var. granulata]